MAEARVSEDVVASGGGHSLHDFLPGIVVPPREIDLNGVAGLVPFTAGQHRTWLRSQIVPTAADNVPMVVRLLGKLDLGRLKTAVATVFSQFPLLSMGVKVQDGEPMWETRPFPSFALIPQPVTNETELHSQLQTFIAEPFEPFQYPFWRVALWQLNPEEHWLVWVTSRLVMDNPSAQICLRELITRYHNPGSQPIQFEWGAVAYGQKRSRALPLTEQHLTFWETTLRDVPPMIQLPVDRRTPQVRTLAGGRHVWQMPPELFTAVSALANQWGVSLPVFMLAVWQLLLYRYTEATDFWVGLEVTDGRLVHGKPVAGLLTDLLPLRARLSDKMTIVELVTELSASLKQAGEHAVVPYEWIVEQVWPKRPLAETWPQLVFRVANGEITIEKEGLTWAQVDIHPGTAVSDLTLELRHTPSQATLHIIYPHDIFDTATINRMTGHLQTLLQAILTTPDTAIAHLPLLTEAEKHQLLIEWNDPHTYTYESLHALFEAQAAAHPNNTAITFTGQQITYNQLNTTSNQIAHTLLQANLQPDQVVAVMLENGPQQVEALFGILKAGGVFTCLDPNYPTSRLETILEEAQPACLIAEGSCLERHPDLWAQLDTLNCTMLAYDNTAVIAASQHPQITCIPPENWQNAPTHNPDIKKDPTSPAYIVYTSGSTGRPKGIMQSHLSFCQFIDWQSRQIGIVAPERFAQWASIAYDASYCEIFGTLCFGATLCMAPANVRFNPRHLVAWARSEKITILQFVPSFARQVVELLLAEPRANGHHPLPDLRVLMLAGEILPVDLARAWLELFPNPPRLFNLYGPSECVLATWYEVKEVKPDQLSIPVGRAIDGRQILILDKEQQLCPIGVRGEIYVRSNYLTMGYVHRPEETQRKFIQNPLHNDYPDPVYRTGDMGRWLPDGTIEFFGRMDNLVKLRGIRVELGDIEAALRQHDQVRNCAVVVRTVRRKQNRLVAKEWEIREQVAGGGQQVLMAYYTADVPLSATELRAFLEARLPAHMIPQQFVQLDELPLNANHKLDLRALPEPENVRPVLSVPYVAPRDELEQCIAAVWRDVLGIDRVGAKDGFFELGGDSLLAMQVLNRLRDEVARPFSFRDLFVHQTVEKLAALARQETAADRVIETSRKTAVSRTTFPLSHAQQGIWYLWQLDPDNPYYTAQGVIHLRGPIDTAVLRRAWQALIERHAILRARFATENGRPVQFFDRPLTTLPLIDLTHLPKARRRSEMEKMMWQKGQHALDLENDPLVQAQLYKISDTEYEIGLTFHEITLDLWALSLMIRDLGQLYTGFLQDNDTPLPPLAFGFEDYVVWESEHMRRETLAEQATYWQEQLAGELPVLDLPTDRPYPTQPTYKGAATSLMLTPELTAQLRQLSQKHNATLFMTLLACFKLLLRIYSGQEDIIVGAPIANRTRAHAEEIVGFFLNMLPLRTRTSREQSFAEFLAQVREVVTGGIINAEYPFSWMLENANVRRDASTAPVFQVMFNMLNLPHTSLTYDDLEIAFSELDTGYIKYDMALYAQEHGDQIFLQLAYLTDLFDAETAERMLNNLVVILQHAVTHPEHPLTHFPTMTTAERQAILYTFNQTQQDFQNTYCIHQLFEQQVERTPDKTAFIFNDQHLTYAELNRRANQLAHYLRRQGVGPQTRVAICTERSFEMIIGLMGILKAGGAYVALDPDYPVRRLNDILTDTDPAFLILQKKLDRFDQFTGQKVYIDQNWSEIGQESDANLENLSSPDDLFNIVYTSSSTGKPKGVLIPGRAVLNRLFWMWTEYPFREDDVAVLQKSYALVAASWELFGALLKGVPTLILSSEDVLDPVRFWEKVTTYRVTYLLAAPALYEGVLRQAEAHPNGWESLRLATTSAEPIPPAMVYRWQKRFPHVPLLNLYGASECASNVMQYDVRQLPPNAVRVPVGKPLPNMQVYVLDEALNPVPIGVTGELCVSGVCLAWGYLNMPELTAEKFVPNPFVEEVGARLYRTGDLARWRADGTIELVGRADYQVKIRGFRVELNDVEAVLAQHEGVEKCAVVLYAPDEAQKRLVAYVQPKTAVSPTDLRHFLRERLPGYMVPADYVLLDKFPLTPTGKIDRKNLPVPEKTLLAVANEYVPPRNELEAALVEIWQKLLKRERIGIHDNFFDLGGHSLLSAQLFAAIDKQLNKHLPLATLFRAPTIAELAECLVTETADTRSSLVPIQPNGDRYPFYCVHGVGGHVIGYYQLAQLLGHDQPFYGIRARGVDDQEISEQMAGVQLEQMAANYVAEILAHQPEGPYFIGGFSFGGVVAFEMARQLHAMGHEVRRLILLDTTNPAYKPSRPLQKRLSRWQKLRQMGVQEAIVVLKDKVEFQLGYRWRWTKEKVENLWHKANYHIRNKLGLEISRELKYAYLQTRRGKVALQYMPEPYAGEVYLLRRREGHAVPHLGWEGLALGGLHIRLITGRRHIDILEQPDVQVLARELRACLDEAYE